jgi:hypothetical protein
MAVIDQIFTQKGEEFCVDKLMETTQNEPKYIGQGTGTGTVAKGDVDLWTPATEARVTGVLSEAAADKLQVVGTIVADGTKTITEFGVFDAAGSGSPPSGGNLLMHFEMDPQAVDASDEIEFTATLEFQ